MNEALEKYNVLFYKEMRHNRYVPIISSVNEILNMFFLDYYQAYLAQDFIIFEIDNVINGVVHETTIVSESVISIKIARDISEIYGWDDSPTALPVFVLPTQDFKEIAISWMNYLQINRDFKT
jgi:hypothetical protein